MDYAHTFAVSAAGMAVERARVEAAAMNIANANTVHAPGGPAYRPVRVVARTLAVPFAELVGNARPRPSLPAASIETVEAGARMVQDPGHPFANEQGFVAYPAVDAATEMVGLMGAMRSYEANVAAMNTARTLALRTLEIGKGS
jgi:flagellar basal-body rod protein FlgC